jgi:hypothetical protein
VLPAWWVSHVDHDFHAPRFREFFAALATRFTVVRYDRTGVGLSDRERPCHDLDGREVAAAIPAAELIALDGREHLPWLGRTAEVLAALDIGPPRSGTDSAGEDDSEVLALRRDGDVWRIRWAGRTLHARHYRGLGDLAIMVAHPGRHFAATELVAAANGEPQPHATHGGPVLDETARAQFHTRLTALDEELAAALAADRVEHAAQLEAERDAILRELRAATGLGGRRRALGDDREHARKAVTARIRESIARLRQLDSALGDHLERGVETGSTCVYAPPTPLRARS